jgi:myo-inositol-1(or 4)-monophosphatase
MNDLNLSETLKFSEKLCLEVGRFIFDHKQKFQVAVHKTELLDIATNIDLEVEKIIIERLLAKFPNFNIVSEEKGLVAKKSPYSWIIDPLDGTKEFVRNIPSYTVNLALEKDSEIILGVSYNPSTKYLFSVAKNEGSFLNHKRVQVSPVKKLTEAFIYTHLPDYRHSESFDHIWQNLGKIARHCYRLRGEGHDGNSLCFTAMGAIDGYVLLLGGPKWHPHWWDVATGILMVKEAGGVVTNIDGQPIIKRDLSKGIIAANAKIHAQLLDIINNIT